eukprot:CAMPEP_0202691308 /NCGR_PEP_ID=MMETSP1385-20130828/6061_1 /ASSEMBLY_ACC=CAM_ASM_000861 /TAXON_ID=933848 /ORGANISM="Elphidium margaritaceum" /LENGTH=155 /DNA_ID=CAMNT_0049346693 /DNA_START=178 /DNA_END=645 /DNA_ORIENTATION=+
MYNTQMTCVQTTAYGCSSQVQCCNAFDLCNNHTQQCIPQHMIDVDPIINDYSGPLPQIHDASQSMTMSSNLDDFFHLQSQYAKLAGLMTACIFIFALFASCICVYQRGHICHKPTVKSRDGEPYLDCIDVTVDADCGVDTLDGYVTTEESLHVCL